MKTDYLNKLAELSLKIANIIDRHGENGDFAFAYEIGLGYLALSGYLRAGVKAIADIQMDYSNAISAKHLAKSSESEMRNFLTDIFGDEEPESLNDEYKQKIKDFVKGLLQEDSE